MQKAIEWYKKAVEQNDINSQYNIAHFYQKGLYIEKHLNFIKLLQSMDINMLN